MFMRCSARRRKPASPWPRPNACRPDTPRTDLRRRGNRQPPARKLKNSSGRETGKCRRGGFQIPLRARTGGSWELKGKGRLDTNWHNGIVSLPRQNWSITRGSMHKTVRSSRFRRQIVRQNERTSPRGTPKPADRLHGRFPAQQSETGRLALREAAKEPRAKRRAEAFASCENGALRRTERTKIIFVYGSFERRRYYPARVIATVRRRDAAQARRTKRTHLELIRANSQVIGNPPSGKVV